MAKDNVPFHSIIFPATLMGLTTQNPDGTLDKWKVVDRIYASDYINYEGKRFSKSDGVGIFCNDTMESGITSDIWRFYLTYIRPENNDSSFQWKDFVQKVNTELVNNYSNLCNRILSFTYKKCGKKIPPISNITIYDKLNKDYLEILSQYNKGMESGQIRNALRKFLEFSTRLNVFLNEHEPWKTVKTDRQMTENVLAVGCHFVIALNVMASPFIPTATAKLFNMVDVDPKTFENIPTYLEQLKDVQMSKPSILFTRLDEGFVRDLASKFN